MIRTLRTTTRGVDSYGCMTGGPRSIEAGPDGAGQTVPPAMPRRYDQTGKRDERRHAHLRHRARAAGRRAPGRRGTSADVRRPGPHRPRGARRRRRRRGRCVGRRARARPRRGAGPRADGRPRARGRGARRDVGRPAPGAHGQRGPRRARRRRAQRARAGRAGVRRRRALAREARLGRAGRPARGRSGGRRADQRADAVGPPRRGMGAPAMTAVFVALIIIVAVATALAGASVRILREYERAVVFRLGRLLGQKGPGIVLLIPGIDRMVRVDLRTVTFDVPPQDLITRDNVPAKVNAVTYFRVVDPVKSVVEVERYRAATSQIAQTTLRSVLGKADLDMLLAEREKLNEALQQIIDEQTDPWGIKVTTVEIKDVGIPQGMQRAMARQAEAERERRAKVINAEGEFQASERLFDAAEIMSANPTALQLRYLQTLLELGSSQASTIVFPLPIDLLKPLLQATQYDGTENRPPPRPPVDAPDAPDAAERTVEAADGVREIAGGASGHESRAELDREVEEDIAKQVE